MPDIDQLMDVWPEEFEDAIAKVSAWNVCGERGCGPATHSLVLCVCSRSPPSFQTPLPNVDLSLSLDEYVRVVCAILDIPVYDGR